MLAKMVFVLIILDNNKKDVFNRTPFCKYLSTINSHDIKEFLPA